MQGYFELILQYIKTIEDAAMEVLLTQFVPHRFDWIELRDKGNSIMFCGGLSNLLEYHPAPSRNSCMQSVLTCSKIKESSSPLLASTAARR